jgi:hypothetical protein
VSAPEAGSLPKRQANGCFRRVSPVAVGPGEGPLTEPTADARACPWGLVKIPFPVILLAWSRPFPLGCQAIVRFPRIVTRGVPQGAISGIAKKATLLSSLDWRMFALRQSAISSVRGCRVESSPFSPIVSYMVNYNERLDRIFAALVDPTRERFSLGSNTKTAHPSVLWCNAS